MASSRRHIFRLSIPLFLSDVWLGTYNGIIHNLLELDKRGNLMPQNKVVAKLGIKREKGYLYYLDKQGDVSRAPMKRGGDKSGKKKAEKVAKAGVQRQS